MNNDKKPISDSKSKERKAEEEQDLEQQLKASKLLEYGKLRSTLYSIEDINRAAAQLTSQDLHANTDRDSRIQKCN